MKVYLISKAWIVIPFIYHVVTWFYFIKFKNDVRYYGTDKEFFSVINLAVSFFSIILVTFISCLYRIV